MAPPILKTGPESENPRSEPRTPPRTPTDTPRTPSTDAHGHKTQNPRSDHGRHHGHHERPATDMTLSLRRREGQ